MLPKELPLIFSSSKKLFITSPLWSIKNNLTLQFFNYLELKTVGKEGLTSSGNGVSTSFQPANCPCWQLAKPFVSHHTITLTSHYHSHSICSVANHSHLIAAFLENALNWNCGCRPYWELISTIATVAVELQSLPLDCSFLTISPELKLWGEALLRTDLNHSHNISHTAITPTWQQLT